MMILNLNLNLSAIVTMFAAAYGFYILIKHLHIAKSHIRTAACDALPIILGTLAWSTAALTFLEIGPSYNSPIQAQRIMMVIAWCWLISKYRYRRAKR